MVARHVAARLAAKEAAYKAFQQDPEARAIGWRDMEVIRDESGRPSLQLYGRAADTAARLKVKTLFLSISHTDENAAAVVVLSSD
jgi:holo-[acyl-carrier protein] synthase